MLDFSVTFLISIINIVVLFFILRFLLFKPVTKFMAERAKQVQDSIEQSEKDKNQARALLAQYQDQLRTAEVEAKAIIDSAREQAQLDAEKIIAESRASAEEIITRTRRKLEMEHLAALAIFREEAAALVVAATSRLLGREVKSEDCLSYAEMLLKETTAPSIEQDNT